MPNWCHNRVSFYSDNEQDIKKLWSIFESDEPFNTIVPSPDWKNTPNDKGELPHAREMKNPKGEVFTTVQEFPDGTNDDRWYHWNIQNWGTKWDITADAVDVDQYDSFSIEGRRGWRTGWTGSGSGRSRSRDSCR